MKQILEEQESLTYLQERGFQRLLEQDHLQVDPKNPPFKIIPHQSLLWVIEDRLEKHKVFCKFQRYPSVVLIEHPLRVSYTSQDALECLEFARAAHYFALDEMSPHKVQFLRTGRDVPWHTRQVQKENLFYHIDGLVVEDLFSI